MPINSMTGFARTDGSYEHYRWTWELKSVNGKGLDVKCRVPSFLDGLDIKAKKLAADALTRGSVYMGLQIEAEEQGSEFIVNEERLESLIAIAERYKDRDGIQPASLEGLLAIKGVIETKASELDADGLDVLSKAVLSNLQTAIVSLVKAREEEGARMADVLLGQISTIETLTAEAAEVAKDRVAMMKERFTAQLKKLYDGNAELSEDRLAQEIATIAVKADVCEEIDRLISHVAEGRALLEKGEPVGRRLDFLTQEFNREANTLCSKASDSNLTRIGIELKTVIDQFREQVQNIE